jgi:hypothetical protein
MSEFYRRLGPSNKRPEGPACLSARLAHLVVCHQRGNLQTVFQVYGSASTDQVGASNERTAAEQDDGVVERRALCVEVDHSAH